MKLPNGYGSVYKLSGRRRNPWVARKTVGWKDLPDQQKTFPIYKFIGYYRTRSEALQALSDYNRDPFDMDEDSITLGDLFDRWSAEHFERTGESNIKGIRSSWKVLEALQDTQVKDIKLDHFQAVLDDSGRNTPVLIKAKSTLNMMYTYGVKHELVSRDKAQIIQYIDTSKPGNPNKRKRSIFSQKEIQSLWENNMIYPLILIYTGLRISELLEIQAEDIHLQERWLYVRKSKTTAGIREVPISEKIAPVLEEWMTTRKIMNYSTFLSGHWNTMMESVGMNHKPHDTRHTCVSLLTEALVDDRIIKAIVGHKGRGVTEAVYTHISLESKLEAINKI